MRALHAGTTHGSIIFGKSDHRDFTISYPVPNPRAMATSMDNLIIAPKGTRLWILNLGTLEADAAWFKRGGSTSTRSNPNPASERRSLKMYGILIEHPEEGLILWETGGGRDYPEVVGAPINDIFAQVESNPDEDLEKQIHKCGFELKDLKMIIMGHLHMDHAGGLPLFKDFNIPIVVHELELKNAFFSVATGYDAGVYLPHYLDFSHNWQAWQGDEFEVAQGIMLRLMPGHTPGLSIMQVNLQESGTWIVTTDMYLVKENFEENLPLGFLARDHNPWCASNQKIHALQRRTKAKLLYGHDADTLASYQQAPHAYT